MGTIRLGCSGWDYRDWADVFYKDKSESKLRAYSKIFNTVEINSTFYSYPQPGIVFGWSRYTPQDFRFAVKLNRLITHEKKLEMSKGVEHDLKRFCSLLEPLIQTGKLACVLIQLPPGMKFRKDLMEEFLNVLPVDIHFALEYRNDTWLTEKAYCLLRDHNVAAVAVDEPLLPPEVNMTSDIAYVRWHGRGEKMWYNYHYSEDDLKPWIPKLKEMSKHADVYGYFNNHYHGYAPENCVDILEMLGISTREQKEIKMHISSYRDRKPGIRSIPRTLDDFIPQEKVDIKDLLSGYIEDSRLERAGEIKDIDITEISTDKIVAQVRGYSVYIDFDNRFILHDCNDWKKTAKKRQFCKHIGALMLALPEDTAARILGMIKRQDWEFSQYTGRGNL